MKGDAQGLPLAQMTVYGVKDFEQICLRVFISKGSYNIALFYSDRE